jgi:hypothetical protein
MQRDGSSSRKRGGLSWRWEAKQSDMCQGREMGFQVRREMAYQGDGRSSRAIGVKAERWEL